MSKWPIQFLSEVPVDCFDGSILVQRIAPEFATLMKNHQSVTGSEHSASNVCTNATLLLSTERNVVVEQVVLIDPNLCEQTAANHTDTGSFSIESVFHELSGAHRPGFQR
jgi:hypothetical protein